MKRFWISVFRRVTGILYRIVRLGPEVPDRGPVILVGNHPNGLVDPALMLHVTRRELRFLGKAPLLKIPVLGRILSAMGMLPVFRSQDGHDTTANERTFTAVWDALEQGDVIALFPEGISHNEPSLQRLKTGAARMALGSDPRAAGEVRIVPVGLVYTHKQRFRSRVAMQVGEAIDVAEFRTQAGADDRESVAALTEAVGRGLRHVTVNLESWDELPLLRLAERIWKSSDGTHRVARMGALAKALNVLRERDPERLDRLSERIEEFSLALDRFGVTADHLEIRYTPTRVAAFAMRSAIELVLGLPLSLLALGYWFVPFQLVRLIATIARPNPDIVATIKGLFGLVLYTAWHLLVTFFLVRYFGPLIGAVHFLATPPLTLVGVNFYERHGAALREASIFARIAPEPRLRRNLLRERASIAREMDAIAHELSRPTSDDATQSPTAGPRPESSSLR